MAGFPPSDMKNNLCTTRWCIATILRATLGRLLKWGTVCMGISKSYAAILNRATHGVMTGMSSSSAFDMMVVLTTGMSDFLESTCHQCYLQVPVSVGAWISGFSMWHFLKLVVRGFLWMLWFPPLLLPLLFQPIK